MGDIKFEVLKDFGAFGDGNWQKHVTLTSWGDRQPVLDIRPWDDNMERMGKGVTIPVEDAWDFKDVLEKALEYLEGGE